jgi:hypothetical protein
MICASFEPDSNVTSCIDPHPRKDSQHRDFTEAGMQIDVNAEHWEKVCALICVNFDPDANVKAGMFAHSKKHLSPRTSRQGGQWNDFNDRQ